jgi:hypothetical protein
MVGYYQGFGAIYSHLPEDEVSRFLSNNCNDKEFGPLAW